MERRFRGRFKRCGFLGKAHDAQQTQGEKATNGNHGCSFPFKEPLLNTGKPNINRLRIGAGAFDRILCFYLHCPVRRRQRGDRRGTVYSGA
ncbi:MAG: hypothetical protein AMXMBFR82_07990 [Candidatus Hydrogenedentota bacterium]